MRCTKIKINKKLGIGLREDWARYASFTGIIIAKISKMMTYIDQFP
jgi:hypothetical protein